MDDRGGERIEAILDVRRARTKRARMRNYTYTHTPVIRVRIGRGGSASEGSFSGIMPWAFGRRNVHGYRAPLILSNGNHPEITPGKSAFIVSQLNVPLRNIPPFQIGYIPLDYLSL